jgi:DNA-directed RNA polymerase specialized sigma24 family protein
VITKPPFEAVVSQHGPMVLRVCRAVLGWADADDAWSETFLAALRAYPDLPADANVEAWLVTIAHRKAVAYHYLAGLPYQEIAAIIGGSAEAARRAASDGIAKLRHSYPRTGDLQ